MQYRRNLPHIQPPEGTYFITYILHDVIPKKVMEQLIAERENDIRLLEEQHEKTLSDIPEQRAEQLQQFKVLRYTLQKKYFGKLDNLLDQATWGTPWLKNDTVAQIVQDTIFWANGKHYRLWASCIMSNHVHLLLTLLPDAPVLYQVLQSIKSFSGAKANKILNRSGKFWMRESYDHLVRKNEFYRIQQYILNNPVKAGIVAEWQQYKWTYLDPELEM